MTDSEDEDAFMLPRRNGSAISVNDSSEEEDLSGEGTTAKGIVSFAEEAPTARAGTKEVRTAMYEAFKFAIDTTPVFGKIFDAATDESKKDFDKRLQEAEAEAELIDPKDENDAKTQTTQTTIEAMKNLVFACSAVFHVCELINLSTATAVDMIVGKNTEQKTSSKQRDRRRSKPITSVSFTHQNRFLSQVSSIQSTRNQTFWSSYWISSC
jgi:hypothetical protein